MPPDHENQAVEAHEEIESINAEWSGRESPAHRENQAVESDTENDPALVLGE